jgi:hypothetical protein
MMCVKYFDRVGFNIVLIALLQVKTSSIFGGRLWFNSIEIWERLGINVEKPIISAVRMLSSVKYKK